MDNSTNTSTFQVQHLQKMIDVATDQPLCENNDTNPGIILTHGAGGDMNTPQLRQLAQELAQMGFVVLRFTCKGLNLAYRINVYKTVLEFVQKKYPAIKQWFVGGRSMGARAAVGLVNSIKGTSLFSIIAGVICISYPLHKKGEFTTLRDSILRELEKPLILVSGDNDEMCRKDILERVVQNISAPTDLHWISNAGHSLQSKSLNDVVKNVATFIKMWIQDVSTQSVIAVNVDSVGIEDNSPDKVTLQNGDQSKGGKSGSRSKTVVRQGGNSNGTGMNENMADSGKSLEKPLVGNKRKRSKSTNEGTTFRNTRHSKRKR